MGARAGKVADTAKAGRNSLGLAISFPDGSVVFRRHIILLLFVPLSWANSRVLVCGRRVLTLSQTKHLASVAGIDDAGCIGVPASPSLFNPWSLNFDVPTLSGHILA